MKKKYLAYFIAVAWQGAALSVYSDVIFDVDFEDPPHSLGSAPATGSGPGEPTTADNFVIASGVADFSTQVAMLGTDTAGGSMVFIPSSTFDSGFLTFSWDLAMLVPDDSQSTLQTTLLVSRPAGPDPLTIVQVNYSFDGSVTVTTPESGTSLAGTWTLDEAASYQLAFDLNNDIYDFFIDGSQVVFDDPIGASTVVNHTYFQRPFGSPSFAIDDVQWQVIPEPSTVALLFLALGVVAFRRFHC
jgi:hypothetical protein